MSTTPLLYVWVAPDQTSKVWFESTSKDDEVVRCEARGGVVVSRDTVRVYPRLFDPQQYSFQMLDANGGRRAEDKGGCVLTLRQLQTGKVKSFFMAGAKDPVALISHMNSLTDDLCSQWFNERERKPKKEKQNG